MPQTINNKIPSNSVLPMIAAGIAIISIFCCILRYDDYSRSNVLYGLYFIVVPIALAILFAVFSIVLAKKKLVLMVIPISLMLIYIFFFTSAMFYAFLPYGINGFRMYWSTISPYKIVSIFTCIMIVVLAITVFLTFINILKSGLVSGIIGMVNILLLGLLFILNLTSGYSFIAIWYAFEHILVIGAIMVIMFAIDGKPQPVNVMRPPYPAFNNPNANAQMGQGHIYPNPMSRGNLYSNPPMGQGCTYQQPPMGQGNVYPNSPMRQADSIPNASSGFSQSYPNAPITQADVSQNQTMGQSNVQQSPTLNPADRNTNNQHSPRKEDAVFSTIRQLADLHSQGILTDAEFEDKKKSLLDQI